MIKSRLVLFVILTALLSVGAAWFIYTDLMEARLVRAYPQRVPQDAALMRFAIDAGATVFKEHCATCHGLDGHGDVAKGIANLTDSDWLYGSGQMSEIERIIYYGIRSHHPKAWNLAAMPAFGRQVPSVVERGFAPSVPQEVRDVAEFILSIEGLPADAKMAARGEKVFNENGACYDCHARDGQGDPSIGAPNLVDNIWLYGNGTREAIIESIADGREGMCPSWVSRLSPSKIREVTAFVYSLSHPDSSDTANAR